jgi:serine protease Do
MKTILKKLTLTAFVLIPGLVVGSPQDPKTQFGQTGKAMNPPVNDVPAQSLDSSLASFAPAVTKVAPAVVRIVTALTPDSVTDRAGRIEEPLRRYAFGQLPRERSGLLVECGLGSGVIMTEDGYILTNSHVVNGANEVAVTLPDGRAFKAVVIGLDAQSDLAVVKIDAHDLPTVPLADSQKVRVGDLVLAIGNPFGMGQTVTHGIVSATDRGLGIQGYERFIQIDAPINPGNSGGALVDVTGHLIGINTAILSSSGGNIGIGFAIPSDVASRVLTDLVKYGYVGRGYLGVEAQNLTPELAEEFNLGGATGVLVGGVAPNGPAEMAGLQAGDVITGFDGKEVRDARHLMLSASEAKPCHTARVEVLRNGSAKLLRVVLGQAPDNGPSALADQSADQQDPGALQGVFIIELSSQVRQYLKIPRHVHGAVVLDLHAYSAAAQAGLRPGDVIEAINRQDVRNADEVSRLTHKARDKRALLRVWSNSGSHFLLVNESPAAPPGLYLTPEFVQRNAQNKNER